jgi:hypothetical protein
VGELRVPFPARKRALPLRCDALQRRLDADQLPLYRTAGRCYNRVVPFDKLRPGLLQRTVLRRRAGTVCAGGFDCARSGKSPIAEQVLVCAEFTAEIY